ncbi:MAG: alcohol dehydrogenase catalytic domain-containing protein, partial [Ilumatobacteraceae bacterium]
IWCGTCDHCRRGRVDDCAAVRHVGVHRHGGYAEFVAVPVRNAHCVPNTWDPVDTAVIVRHVPTAVNLLRRAELVDGEPVLVMGAGGGRRRVSRRPVVRVPTTCSIVGTAMSPAQWPSSPEDGVSMWCSTTPVTPQLGRR